MKKQLTFDQRANILFPNAHKGFFKTAYTCTAKQEEVRRYVRFLEEIKKAKIAPSLKERKLAVLNNEIRLKNSSRLANITKHQKEKKGNVKQSTTVVDKRKSVAKPLPRMSKANTKDIVQKLLAPNLNLIMRKVVKKRGYVVPSEVISTHRRAFKLFQDCMREVKA